MARGLLPAITIAAVLLIAPGANAVIGSFGTHVSDADADTVYTLDTTTLTSVVLIDEDGDTRPDVDEAILLVRTGTYVHTTAVRLAYPVDGPLGSQVGSGDADAGLDGVALGGQLAYLDMDGDQAFTPGDFLFYDLDGSQQGTVSVGDVYLTGPAAGTVVTSASSIISRSLTTLSGTWGIDDRDDNGFDAGDPVVVDGDDDGRLSVADVRVGVTTAGQFGTWIPADADRVTRPLVTGDLPDTFVISDTDEDGKVDPGEPVHLSRSATKVQAGSIRLHAPMEGTVGDQVQGGDSDLGLSVVQVSATLRFDGTGDIDANEPLILDHDGSGSGTGDVNELILSGQEAGSRIDAASPHKGESLAAAPGTLSFLDADGDGSHGIYDLLYLDADDDGFISAGDVQLSAYLEEALSMLDPEAQPDPEDPPDGDGDDTDTSNGSGDGTSGDTSDEPDGPADADADGVPDAEDACPNYGAETTDGCPVDRDGDGVYDDLDACPTVAALTESGCPPDADGDGIPDDEDACPDEIGALEDRGCPQVQDPAGQDGAGVAGEEQTEDQQGAPGPGILIVGLSLAGLALTRRRRP